MKKILFFGPYPPPLTGQTISFSTLVDNINSNSKIVLSTTKFNNYKIFNSIYTVLMTFFVLNTHEISTVYFTCSRSTLGFMRDVPLLVLCRLKNIRVINHLHGLGFEKFYLNSGIIKRLIKYAYEKIDTSVVLFDEMKSEFSEFPNMKTVVVSNCYQKEFDTILINKKELAAKHTILFLSNLMMSKGILEFIEAAEKLLYLNKTINIKIAGDLMSDHLKSKIQISQEFNERFKTLKSLYPNQIEYLGIVKGNEKVELLKKTAILILPTYHPTEAFPISIIEGMRMGCAIITTNHNYLPSIISKDNGLIIEPKSSSAIFNAVSTLLLNKENLEKMQIYNINCATEKFSSDIYVHNLKKIVFANQKIN